MAKNSPCSLFNLFQQINKKFQCVVSYKLQMGVCPALPEDLTLKTDPSGRKQGANLTTNTLGRKTSLGCLGIEPRKSVMALY